MKNLNQFILIMLIMIIGVSTSFANEKEVTEKINSYLSAIDSKETKVIDNLVSDDAEFTMLNTIIGEKEILTQDDYLKFVKDGKAGAWVTSTNVKFVNLQGDIAVAYVEAEGKNLIRKEYLSLVKDNGNWEIVNSISTFSKK